MLAGVLLTLRGMPRAWTVPPVGWVMLTTCLWLGYGGRRILALKRESAHLAPLAGSTRLPNHPLTAFISSWSMELVAALGASVSERCPIRTTTRFAEGTTTTRCSL